MAWAELSDVRCYYELHGEGEPLLLIPGLGGTCRLWDPIAPHLANDFSLILIDNRGIGRSVPRRKLRTLADYSSDIAELLDTLQLDRAHVLGLSLGGIIAQRFAIDHPSRVDRLVSRLDYVAGLRDQIAACREADHTNLIGIDVQLLRPCTNEPDRSLRVLKCAGDFGCDGAIAILVPGVITFGNAILEQDAGHAFGCHPVTYFSPFKIHRQKLESATRENHH